MEKKTIVLDADTSGAEKKLKSVDKDTKSLVKSSGLAGRSITKLGNGFKALGTKMKAAGIGIIIGAFVTLREMLTGNIETARKLEVIYKQFQTVLAVVGDRIADLISGTRSLTSVFSGMGKEVREETRAMRQLTLAIQGVRDAERELVVERAKANFIIAQSRLLAEDETKSREERKEALLNAIQVETEVSEKEIRLAKERAKNMEQEIELGRSSEAEFDKLAQLKANVIQLETASLLRQKRVKTEVNTFDREIATEETKRLKTTSSGVKEKTKSYAELHKEMRKGLDSSKDVEGITKDINEANKSFEEIMKLLDKEEKKYHKTQEATIRNSSTKKREIRKEIETLKSQIRNREAHSERDSQLNEKDALINKIKNDKLNESDKNRLEFLKGKLKDEERAIEKGNERRIRKADEFNTKQEKDLKLHLDKKEEEEKKYQEVIAELRLQASNKLTELLATGEEKELINLDKELERRLAMIIGNKEDELRVFEWYSLQVSNIEKKKNQELIDLETQRIEKSFSIASSFAQSLTQLAGDNVKAQKNAAMLGITIDTAAAVSSVIRNAIPEGGGNPVLTPLIIAELLAIVFGGMAQAKGILSSVPGGSDSGANLQGLQAGIGVGGGDVPRLPTDNNIDLDLPPVQAFVVESNVTGKQVLQNELEIQATL